MTLASLQEAVAEVLKKDPWLSKRNVNVLAEDDGDIAAAVEKAVAKLRLVATVATPRLVGDMVDAPIPRGLSEVVVSCFEAPVLNRSAPNRTTALNAAERIACLLTALAWLRDGRTGEEFGVPSFASVLSDVVDVGNKKTLIVYNVTVRVAVALKGDMDTEPPHPPNPSVCDEPPAPETTEEPPNAIP